MADNVSESEGGGGTPKFHFPDVDKVLGDNPLTDIDNLRRDIATKIGSPLQTLSAIPPREELERVSRCLEGIIPKLANSDAGTIIRSFLEFNVHPKYDPDYAKRLKAVSNEFFGNIFSQLAGHVQEFSAFSDGSPSLLRSATVTLEGFNIHILVNEVDLPRPRDEFSCKEPRKEVKIMFLNSKNEQVFDYSFDIIINESNGELTAHAFFDEWENWEHVDTLFSLALAIAVQAGVKTFYVHAEDYLREKFAGTLSTQYGEAFESFEENYFGSCEIDLSSLQEIPVPRI